MWGISTTHPTLSWPVREGFNHSQTLANLWQGLKEKVATTTFPGFSKVHKAFALRVNLDFYYWLTP